ncbi:phosphonate ABC transporter, permease protein PhnE [Cohaesibacter haloalkalitolerans]|uniref:phosphonate ABC transporter, permease protein PhnE n=1 Tax=Cohaesibacter haloalkalitolerans TaxID=1162980 RepID=UPI000E654733|nr:phosphonate ABC transporter, permease protein PhnE [Cohaesibacter haloalkalitolerans]
MNTIAATDMQDMIARYPAVFKPGFFKRFRGALIFIAIVIYAFVGSSFLHIGKVFSNGNWDIAGAYLADWISYEVRPDVKFENGYLNIEFPRFSPLGAKPQPDWIVKTVETKQITPEAEVFESAAPAQAFSFMAPDAPTAEKPAEPAKPSSSFSFMAPDAPTAENPANVGKSTGAARTETKSVTTQADITIGDGHVVIVPGMVTITRGGETLVIDVERDKAVHPRGALPDWAQQKYENEKVVARFGFDGRVEVQNYKVKVHHRFLGWENFIFDTNSPFWNKSAGEVLSLIVSGDRIKPDQSNLMLALDNFFNNAEWQHGDVWIKLMQTIVMAFVGTLFASLIAFPLSFMAARNITPNGFVNQFIKRFFDFLRSVDMLIWALFFTRAFGPGPLAGISAIFFTDTGTLGKLNSETLENIDDKQREGVKSLGASPVLVQRYGVVPQILPVFLSQSLYFWESNTRSATIIGAVGAGGIGLKLWEAMRTNQDWENVFYMVILILIVVYVFDTISNKLRSKLTKG